MASLYRLLPIIILMCLPLYSGLIPIHTSSGELLTINGNTDLESIASYGSGTRDDPFVIDGLRGEYQLNIESFSNYLIIQNSTFSEDDSTPGITIQSSSNIIIQENLFDDLKTGISIISSSDIEIRHNIFYTTDIGLNISDSSDLLISSNLFEYLADNTIDNLSTAISAKQSAGMINNNVFKQHFVGISIGSSSMVVTNNEFRGIEDIAITLDETTTNNRIFWNNYLDDPRIMARDDGTGNSFQANYWVGWTSPDDDNDGTVDLAFSIAGIAQNKDSSPRAELNEVFLEVPQQFIRDTSGNTSPQVPLILSILLLLIILIMVFLRGIFMKLRLNRLTETTLVALVGTVPPALVSIINSDISDDENETDLYIPPELMEFKKILDPVRLSVFTVLYDEKKMVSSDLRKQIKVSWGTYSHALRILIDEGYIQEENEFINETVLKVLLITYRGEVAYRELRDAMARLFRM